MHKFSLFYLILTVFTIFYYIFKKKIRNSKKYSGLTTAAANSQCLGVVGRAQKVVPAAYVVVCLPVENAAAFKTPPRNLPADASKYLHTGRT